ncbi:nuclear transport factor 2 family protein [Nocardioides rotundus]|uniref:nuclear transport factor 2 family protein n=1 Tax=Nocardioides rotundus TaxID=1774216 RepID=UPI001CBC4107|nr:nuclear transport factor 2 family protein [Nocardioides rotundus]UAL31655.1 nuclear transport factor 2 family protein [Nocardioides rotundus]
MRSASRPVNAVLALVAVVLVCVLGVVLANPANRPAGDSAAAMMGRALTDWDGDATNDETRRHRDVAATARAATLAFLDVDHRDMQPRIEAVLATATGPFAEEYAAQRDDLVRSARQSRSVSRGSVVAVGVSEANASSAVVLVAANATVDNRRTDGEQVRQLRLRLEMQRTDEGWRTAGLEFVR